MPPIQDEAKDGLIKATDEIKTPAIRIIIFAAVIIICSLVASLIWVYNSNNKISERELAGCQTENTNLKNENVALKNEIIAGIKAENKRLTDRERWQDSVSKAIDKIKKQIP